MSDFQTRVPGTTVTLGDLVLMGHTMLNLSATSVLMRHETPAGTLDYALPDCGIPGVVVHDFAWWCGRREEYQFNQARLIAFLNESGWQAQMLPALDTGARLFDADVIEQLATDRKSGAEVAS